MNPPEGLPRMYFHCRNCDGFWAEAKPAPGRWVANCPHCGKDCYIDRSSAEAVRAEPEVKNPCPKCGKAMRRFSPWPAFFCEGCNKGAAEAESSPTPETDAHQAKEGMAHDWLWRDFARRLERERDALKAENGRLRAALEGLMEWNGVYDSAVAGCRFPSLAAHFMDRGKTAREALAGKETP